VRFFYLLFFLLLFSCSSLKKNDYVCGDRPCIDKKEYDKYFSVNLTIEIIDDKKKKNQSVDLVKLNTNTPSLTKENKKKFKVQEKSRKKTEKDNLKAEKIALLEERKIKEKEEKLKRKKDKKIMKVLKSNNNKNETTKSKTKNNNKQVKKTDAKIAFSKNNNKKNVIKKEIQIDSTKTENIKGICDEIEDCDIDKITEILIKKGEKKPFPNIVLN